MLRAVSTFTQQITVRGRGARSNASGRFESQAREAFDDGWTLEDAQNHSYAFPDFSLAAGAAVKVRTGEGNDSATDLFWNRSSSIWNNGGDVATLKDASGNIVASYPEES